MQGMQQKASKSLTTVTERLVKSSYVQTLAEEGISEILGKHGTEQGYKEN